MKKIFLLLFLLPALAGAQPTEQRSAQLLSSYDVASTGYIYCRLLGTNANPFGAEIQGVGLAKTTGSSANIAEAVADANPFAGLAVGDILIFRIAGVTYQRRIITYTSDSAVVVNTAIDLGSTGVPFTYLKQSCGTAATDGWIDVALSGEINFVRDITTINATSIESQVECRVNGTGAIILDTKTIGTTGAYSYIVPTAAWDACRLGVKVSTDTGIQAITARVLLVR